MKIKPERSCRNFFLEETEGDCVIGAFAFGWLDKEGGWEVTLENLKTGKTSLVTIVKSS